jgi:hypothetical protein
VSTHAQQLGVVEVHSRLFRVAQRHLQSLARLLRLARGDQEAADDRIVKREITVEV